jgi:hypothetical protein
MASLRKYKRRSMRYTKARKSKSYHKRNYSMNSRRGKRRRRRTRRRNSRKMRGGGWSQFQTNVPRSSGYSLGGELTPTLSALANPAPFFGYKKCH